MGTLRAIEGLGRRELGARLRGESARGLCN